MKSRDLIGLDSVIGAFTTSYVKPAYVAPKPTYVAPAPAPAYVAPRPAMTTTAVPVTQAPKPTMTTTKAPAPAVAPRPTMTSAKPLKAQAAFDAAKTDARANANKAVQKLLAAASRSSKKSPKRAQKLTSIANAIKKRVSIIGDPYAEILGELGLDFGGGSSTTFEATALTRQQFYDYNANVDALIICIDIANAANALADEQLTPAGLTNLAAVGKRIAADCDAIIDIVNNDPEKNVGSRVTALSENAHHWTDQANAALAETSTTTTDTTDTTDTTPGGGGEGGSGAPEGEGEGEAEGGEGEGGEGGEGEGGPFDDVAPSGDAGAVPGGGETREFSDEEAPAEEEQPVEEAQPAGYIDAETVTAVQKALVAKEYAIGEDPEGVFGEGTAEAVRQLQVAEGLTETGIIDDEVLTALGVLAPAQTASFDPFANTAAQMDDVRGDLFASIVGELYGKRVVGAVRQKPQVIPKAPVTPAATVKPSVAAWFRKPMWTGSKVLIWHGAVGAGAAVTLSGIAIAVLRRKK